MIDPGEEVLTCPYNKAHVILRSRMQFHLTKCRKAHPNMPKVNCPFNSTHVLNEAEFETHVEHCPNRGVIDNWIYRMTVHEPPAGVLPVQTIDIGGGNDDEDWDEVPSPSSVPILTQIANNALTKNVLIPKIGASKSERKAHRLSERKRHAALNSGSTGGGRPSQPETPPSTARSTEPVQSQAPAPAPAAATQEQKILYCGPPPNMPEAKFVHPQPSGPATTSGQASAWSGGKQNAPQVNSHDFPTLGSKGNTRRDNDNSLQDQLNNLSLDSDRNERPNAWAKPSPRQQDVKISVPSGGPSGPNRSHSNPWGSRPQQPASASAPANGQPPRQGMPSIDSEDFPTLSTKYQRGKKY